MRERAKTLVNDTRERIAGALGQTKDTYAILKRTAAREVKAGDTVIRTQPQQALGVAFGAGVLLGVLLRRRN